MRKKKKRTFGLLMPILLVMVVLLFLMVLFGTLLKEKEVFDPEQHNCLEYKEIIYHTIPDHKPCWPILGGYGCGDEVPCKDWVDKPFCDTKEGLTEGVENGECVCDEREEFVEEIMIITYFESGSGLHNKTFVLNDVCNLTGIIDEKECVFPFLYESDSALYLDSFPYKFSLTNHSITKGCVSAHEPNECEKGEEGWVWGEEKTLYHNETEGWTLTVISGGICREKILNDLSCERLKYNLDCYGKFGCKNYFLKWGIYLPYKKVDLLVVMLEKGCFS